MYLLSTVKEIFILFPSSLKQTQNTLYMILISESHTHFIYLVFHVKYKLTYFNCFDMKTKAFTFASWYSVVIFVF